VPPLASDIMASLTASTGVSMGGTLRTTTYRLCVSFLPAWCPHGDSGGDSGIPGTPYLSRPGNSGGIPGTSYLFSGPLAMGRRLGLGWLAGAKP